MPRYEFEEALFHLQYNSHKQAYWSGSDESIKSDERSGSFIRHAGLLSRYEKWRSSREWLDRRLKVETIKNDKDTYWIILSAPRDHIKYKQRRDLCDQPLHVLCAARNRAQAREEARKLKNHVMDNIQKEEESC